MERIAVLLETGNRNFRRCLFRFKNALANQLFSQRKYVTFASLVDILFNVSLGDLLMSKKMDERSLVFYDTNGKIITAADQELIFFVENPSLKKIFPNLFVLLKRLIQNRAARQFLLFMKRVVTGRWHRVDERFFVRKGVYPGMRSDRAEFTTAAGKMIIFCSGENVPADIAVLRQVLLHNQYNISKKNMKGKVVIDAGANVGTFSIYAGKFGAKRIYAFEPVSETFEILKKNIAANGLEKIVIPLNMALGEAAGEKKITYGYAGDAGASMKTKAPIIKTQNADIITIDKFMKGKGPVDFIKMDVEGYEAEVFQGARRTIEKYKPVLSFAAYHHPDDKKKLPEVVRYIREDYSCTLMRRDEEILYCE
jgi:FkbM family methyltransferase